MKQARLLLLSAVVWVLSACNRYDDVKDYYDFVQHQIQVDRDYCSTNVLAATRGLLNDRAWFSMRKYGEKPEFTYDLELRRINGRLFLIHEFLGETNKAEAYYRASAKAYSRYLQSKGKPAYEIPKEELRQTLANQERGLNVGWRKHDRPPQ